MTKFQEFMDRHQVNQYRLHKLTGFSKSQISEWQRGKHLPSLASARRLAAAMRLSIQTVLSQIELRETAQNCVAPDGSFVPRSKKSSGTPCKTNDAIRTVCPYCQKCGQMIQNAA